MELSGHTTPFAVLGHPIGHSLSPAMHNAAIAALNMDAIYLAFDVAPERLMEVLPSMADMGFGGVNLTVPLKEVAFKGLKELDDSAKALGAVNTVEITESGLKGHNTDGYGILQAMREAFDTPLEGLKVFVLGTGGAGRAVAIMLAKAGAGRVALTDLDDERPPQVAAEIKGLAPDTEVVCIPCGADNWKQAALDADLVIQSTPVGMKETDESLLGSDCFKAGQMAFDLVYMFPKTAFMRAAEEGGAKSSNGLGMLLHQGARAFTIWTGKDPDVEVMRAALEERVYGADK